MQFWQVSSGNEVRRIPSNKSDRRISRMAWSGDGRVLATWAEGNRIYLWDADTGKQRRELDVTENRGIDSLVFSPDSRVLAVLRMKKVGVLGPDHILLWEVDSGRLLHTLELPTDPPYLISDAPTRLAFSPDGRTLVAGSQRGEASIYGWELASGRLRLTLKLGEDVACLAFSPDGKILAAANRLKAYRNYMWGPDGLGLRVPLPYVHIWDLAAGKEIQVLKGHKGTISSLTFSPDNKVLATGSDDTTVLLWDVTRFKTKQSAEVRLRPEDLESLWADLGGEDAVKAYRAIRKLAGAPEASVVFLKRRLKPVAPADAKQVSRLLADLVQSSGRYAERRVSDPPLCRSGTPAGCRSGTTSPPLP